MIFFKDVLFGNTKPLDVFCIFQIEEWNHPFDSSQGFDSDCQLWAENQPEANLGRLAAYSGRISKKKPESSQTLVPGIAWYSGKNFI